MKSFSVDCMKLKLVPSSYRRNVLLPASYAKNPATATRRPEDVLDFIPGKFLILFSCEETCHIIIFDEVFSYM